MHFIIGFRNCAGGATFCRRLCTLAVAIAWSISPCDGVAVVEYALQAAECAGWSLQLFSEPLELISGED